MSIGQGRGGRYGRGLEPVWEGGGFGFHRKVGVGNIPNKLDGVPVAVRVTGEFVVLGGPPAPVASFTVSCDGLGCDFDGSSSTGRKLGFESDFENDGSFDATGAQVNNV